MIKVIVLITLIFGWGFNHVYSDEKEALDKPYVIPRKYLVNFRIPVFDDDLQLTEQVAGVLYLSEKEKHDIDKKLVKLYSDYLSVIKNHLVVIRNQKGNWKFHIKKHRAVGKKYMNKIIETLKTSLGKDKFDVFESLNKPSKKTLRYALEKDKCFYGFGRAQTITIKFNTPPKYSVFIEYGDGKTGGYKGQIHAEHLKLIEMGNNIKKEKEGDIVEKEKHGESHAVSKKVLIYLQIPVFNDDFQLTEQAADVLHLSSKEKNDIDKKLVKLYSDYLSVIKNHLVVINNKKGNRKYVIKEHREVGQKYMNRIIETLKTSLGKVEFDVFELLMNPLNHTLRNDTRFYQFGKEQTITIKKEHPAGCGVYIKYANKRRSGRGYLAPYSQCLKLIKIANEVE